MSPTDFKLPSYQCPQQIFEEVYKYGIREDFLIPYIDIYEKFLQQNDIGIAGIEINIYAKGEYWTYDVNTNTNYNRQAETMAEQSAPEEIARYLSSLSLENQSGSTETGNRNKNTIL